MKILNLLIYLPCITYLKKSHLKKGLRLLYNLTASCNTLFLSNFMHFLTEKWWLLIYLRYNNWFARTSIKFRTSRLLCLLCHFFYRYFDFYPEDSIKLPANPYIPTDFADIAWSNFDELRTYKDIRKAYCLTPSRLIILIVIIMYVILTY